jgi:hypothetical protein
MEKFHLEECEANGRLDIIECGDMNWIELAQEHFRGQVFILLSFWISWLVRHSLCKVKSGTPFGKSGLSFHL